MKKVFEFGKVDYNQKGRKDCLVTLEVELKYIDGNNVSRGKPVFSVCGNVWNPSKKDIYMGGQCIDSVWNEFAHEIENKELYIEIMDLWQKYHLNDLNPGTPAQTAAIEAWEKAGNKYEYTAACEYLKSIGLYEVELDGEPYKYGHKWLYRPIPGDDLKRINKVLELG